MPDDKLFRFSHLPSLCVFHFPSTNLSPDFLDVLVKRLMASTSARHGDGGAGRIRNAASTLYSDNQSLVGEIRKIMNVIKGVAVDLEKENQTQMVKELDDAVIELLSTSEDCIHFSSAIQSVGTTYQPGENLTDFKKLLEDEVTKLKAANAPSVPQNNPQLRQFREAIWRVHHAGQPMPGEEQEDIVMTSTQSNIVNTTCPLSGKPIIELTEPVRSMDCRHIYDKAAVMHYMKNKRQHPQCPVAGCPRVLQATRVLCDPELLLDIDEFRSMTNQTARPDVYEDFTEHDEEE